LSGRRLRLGYLSSDFREHPTARLVNGLLRHHDRSHFELFMYCSGWDDGSALRREVESHFDHIHSVAHLGDAEAARLIRSHRVDVLVELNGPTRAHRMGVLAFRPAPVQVDYLGWPGSVGGRAVDYVVGDAITVPPGAEEAYPERVIRLSRVYQVNDYAVRTLPPKPTRAEVGLPEGDYLVLGMFNAINKVHNEVWDVWMQILAAVPNALLWILDPGREARKLIARAALARGMPVKRILAAPRLAEEQHLARLQHCDLLLDPWPYGGHTSTSDALFAGVPVVALEGKNFAGRVSGALLRAAGMGALVRQSRESYAKLAVGLLRDPAELARVKAFVREQVPKSDVFDARGKARQLEAAYRAAVDRVVQGREPACMDMAAERSVRGGPEDSHVRTATLRGIPKIIHQTASDLSTLAPEIRQNIDHLRALNPGWAYRFYSDPDAAEFIRTHYGPRHLQAWESISPMYGAARADLFRYLLVYRHGGVYLDVKSSASRPLDEVLRADDSFIISHWNNARGERYAGWGIRPELRFSPRGEYQQWFIAAAPGHPFLAAVIDRVLENVSRYRIERDGVGKRATLAVTGPVAYTQAIHPIRDKWPHREVCADRHLGLVYSIYVAKGLRAHEGSFANHYSKQSGPLVVHRRAGESAMEAPSVTPVDPELLAPVRSLTVDGIRYRFERQLGAGEFSTVYKATDEWGHALAVKVYPPEADEALWKNEATQLRRFAGPGVPYLHRLFAHERHTYLVLDDVGVPMSRCRPDTPEQRLELVMLVAKGVLPVLSRLHLAGHCHGAINPRNVLLRSDGQGRLQPACLVDFARCRSLAYLDEGSIAKVRWVPPPECCLQQVRNGTALDVWHVGALLLQVMRGVTLDYSEADILADQPLRDAQALGLPISAALSAALARDPTRRPDSLGLWRRIQVALDSPAA